MRRLPFPPWAAALAVIWIGLVLAAAKIQEVRGLKISLCPFKALTGIPCPACGGTRALLALIEGRPVEGLLRNPLLVLGGALALAWLLLRVGFAKSPSFELSPWERRATWAALALLIALNWAYVIWRGN